MTLKQESLKNVVTSLGKTTSDPLFKEVKKQFLRGNNQTMARIIQRMLLKGEDVETAAAKTAPAGIGALAIFRFLSTVSLSEAAAYIGGGSVAAGAVVGAVISAGEFLLLYTGTKLILENTKTGEKFEAAANDAVVKLFWNVYYKLGGGKVDKALTDVSDKAFWGPYYKAKGLFSEKYSELKNKTK